DPHEYVSAPRPCRVSRTPRRQIRHDPPAISCETQSACEVGCNGLHLEADLTAVQVTVLSKLRVCDPDDGARDREAEALAAARVGNDERVDPDELPARIDQRSAAVATIDRRVGLD